MALFIANDLGEQLNGTEFDDTLLGGDGDDTILGNDGNDKILLGLGSDSADGGDGFDSVEFTDSTTAVSIDLANGLYSGGTASGGTFANFERWLGSTLNDTMLGSSGADRLFGGAGDDDIRGGDARDIIGGGAGADTMLGGDGIDWLVYIRSDVGVTVNMATGTGTGGHAQNDSFSQFENLRGSAFDDHLIGDGLNNKIVGLAGDDTLTGGGGNDTFIGGYGSDSFEGGDGIDTVTYRNAPIFRIGVIIDERLETSSGASAGDSFDSIEIFVGSDTANDSLILGDANNKAYGLGGNEFIDTGNGDDLLVGGAGGDFLHGGNGSDTVGYFGSSAGVTLNLQTGQASGGDADGDTLSWIENANGSRHADYIGGNILVNVLRGNAGDDTLIGLDGADTLIGGQGADSFVFVERSDHQSQSAFDGFALSTRTQADADSILDFAIGEDILQVATSEFGSSITNTDSIAAMGLTSATDHGLAYNGSGLFHVSYADATAFSNNIATIRHLTDLSGVASLSLADFDFV